VLVQSEKVQKTDFTKRVNVLPFKLMDTKAESMQKMKNKENGSGKENSKTGTLRRKKSVV